jgi:hypothetical protein
MGGQLNSALVIPAMTTEPTGGPLPPVRVAVTGAGIMATGLDHESAGSEPN